MSANYEKVKYFYDHGYWDKRKVHDAVTHPTNGTPWITKDEYKLITGEDYTE